jgi:hypothetical protein
MLEILFCLAKNNPENDRPLYCPPSFGFWVEPVKTTGFDELIRVGVKEVVRMLDPVTGVGVPK